MIRKLFLLIAILMAIPSLCHAEAVQMKVSSFVPQAGSSLFNASALSDGDESTGWLENVDGNGAGQWVQFVFPNNVVVDSVVFRNGLDSESADFQVAKVKGVRVSFGGVHRQSVNLKDTDKMQKIEAVKCITKSLELTIDSVHSNATNSVAGFSEILVEYHDPSTQELAALVISKKVLVKEPYLTPKQRELLAEKLEKLEQERILRAEVEAFFDKFYTAFVTISEEYPRMFVEAQFLRESSYFESFRAMLDKRGVLEKYQNAIVSTSGLRYNFRTHTPTEIELWVKGDYTVIFDLRDNLVTENSLYTLKRELGEWKVKSKVEF
ncbi:NADase-type glycan-binding domain-containing protein [Maridesulfovibrio frigidus]|uniref:NADase-type glycan-binding domain-containing protein n=1 Tax=Maridesulfovibrio frigidus TaxID=340956 RepID=UPI0004E19666|nr:hypothetical protein [Maridesulfovibrio frigidus]